MQRAQEESLLIALIDGIMNDVCSLVPKMGLIISDASICCAMWAEHERLAVVR